jgi:long-chain acyl-CoA synthetase
VDEARYLLTDCGARVVVIHADLLHRLRAAIPNGVMVLVVPTSPALQAAYGIDAAHVHPPAGTTDWNVWRDGFAPRIGQPVQIPNTIIYTSGTTGKPKGVRRDSFTESHIAVFSRMLRQCYGFEGQDPSTIRTAIVGPIYHSAPNAHANFSLSFGADILMLPRFDPEGLLAAIEEHRITHLNMVPIMFVRLLKLPESVRKKYDISSLRFMAHAAAPCPMPVKRAMIDWWGDVVNEYYGTTEMGNVTFCTAQEWLAHPGTVGRLMPGGQVRVIGADGNDMPPRGVGEVIGGTIGMPEFTYHGDDEKRRRAGKFGLIAPGDIGYFDEDGFLYLCDRANDMIISGGANIYPAEIEAELHKMPLVADCAVFGVPDEEFGEAVCAVIQPDPGAVIEPDAVRQFLRARIAGYKVPRIVSFADSLPREDSGKIFKRKLRDPYWEGMGRRI